MGQAVKLLQVFFGFRTGQFLQVALAKEQPTVLAERETTFAIRWREQDREATRAWRSQIFDRPRGHRRSTRTRVPSERDTDS